MVFVYLLEQQNHNNHHDSSSNVYQFDGLMRELTSTDNEGGGQHQIMMMSNGNETNHNHLGNATMPAADMDWNNTELIALYQELDQHESLMAAAGSGAAANTTPTFRNSKQILTPSSIIDIVDAGNRMSFTFLPVQTTTSSASGASTTSSGLENNMVYHQYVNGGGGGGNGLTNSHHHNLIENGQNSSSTSVVVDATNIWEFLEPDYNQINQIMATNNSTTTTTASSSNGFLQSPTI